jgi:hypothetical protein
MPIPNPEDAQEVVFDREQAFLLYATFCGDLEKTAHALNVRPVEVLRMVDEEGWNERLKAILELKKSGRPGDIERAINRALNFVMAHKFRLFLERVLFRLTGMNETEFEEHLLMSQTKEGASFPKLSTRALADLASAMEKAQAMTYHALNDTAPERVKRKVAEDDSTAGGELHARIAEAMAQVKLSRTPRAALFDAQVSKGNQLTKEAIVPASPHDDDTH